MHPITPEAKKSRKKKSISGDCQQYFLLKSYDELHDKLNMIIIFSSYVTMSTESLYRSFLALEHSNAHYSLRVFSWIENVCVLFHTCVPKLFVAKLQL